MSDDGSVDVEFLYDSETQPLQCQVCDISLQPLTLQQRQAHYDAHFEDQPSTSIPLNNSQSTSTNIVNSSTATTKGTAKPSSQNIFWLPTQTTPPPSNFTPGVIPVLKHALLKTHAKGLTSKAVLCHSDATHIATEIWDVTWGCGYRNFLMACISLMTQSFQPFYFPLLDDQEKPPGIHNLQHWIEDAWAKEFDREGADELKHKLVGTHKWIGTAELYVAFTSKGIPAQLVDFPGTKRGPEAVIEWVVNYFSPANEVKLPLNAFDALKGAKPVVITERMPIILQHAGHSRTVVGYEMNKKGEPNLLVFDPAKKMKRNLRQAALSVHSPSADNQKKASSFIDRLFNSHKDTSYDRKRRLSGLGADKRENKRAKGKKQESTPEGKDPEDVIVISDETGASDEDGFMDGLDPVMVVNSFKVNQAKLAKKDKYQILYFPLEDPLTEVQKRSRQVVTSVVVL